VILLDTCSLLWLGAAPEKLSDRARKLIEANPGGLFVSSISAFEIAIKQKRKKLALAGESIKWFRFALEHLGIRELEVNAEIFAHSVSLPDHHKDPCDRVIAATAILHDLRCLTPDPLIRLYPGVIAEW
jgi:PIN domain nuclease of toxin-antitoxin system